MKILGISAYYHDSAAALVCDGKVIAAAQEERFTRKKHDASFPLNAIRFCLDFGDLEIEDLDAVVFYEKPFLKFERLLETYYNFIPLGIVSFVAAMPVWIKEKLFLKKILQKELRKFGNFNPARQKLLFPEHHLSHAASAFYTSPFVEAVIVTIDGVGEWATASISVGDGAQIRFIKEMRFPHSVGLLYSSFTYFLGFRVNSGEYKVMGLAPYSNPASPEVKRYTYLIKRNIVKVKSDGSIWLNKSFFSYATHLRMIRVKKWEQLFGVKLRKPDNPLDQTHCDLACAIQLVTEEIVMKIIRHAKTYAMTATQSQNLCLAGGVALNCVANGRILEEQCFSEIYIQPAAGDAGGAIGAALAAHHIYGRHPRVVQRPDGMTGSFLGPEYDEKETLKTLRRYKAAYQLKSDFAELTSHVAGLLVNGKIIGWFQGRMEFGPRALGNRSILANAREPEMQQHLNLKIKFRESFRPFAPAVLAEEKHHYFNLRNDSPYMLLVSRVNEARCNHIPGNYYSMPLTDRLNFQRSDIPAVTHVDFSARVQTVHKNTNEKFWQLLETYKQHSGYAVIINTSFNVRGEPIVCTPEDAYKCFMRTEMDYLVIGNFILRKEDQPPWQDKHLLTNFALD